MTSVSSILPSSVFPISEFPTESIDPSQRMRVIDSANRTTRSTFHSDGKGIHLILNNGTTLDLRVGTVVQCDVVHGGTSFLKVICPSVSGKNYPNHPIGFHYSEWVPENGWLMGTHPIGLYPGSEGHCVTHGFHFDTMRLCPNPDGSPVPTYFAPLETPEERGRQLVVALSAKWSADVPRLIQGTSLDYVDPNGDTALHYACRFKYTMVAYHLLQLGANASTPNKIGETPLHEACRTNSPYLVRAILREGCAVDAQTARGDTPLMRACLEENVAVVRALLYAGASVNARNKNGETPLMFACYNSHRDLEPVKKIMSALLQAGAVVDVEVSPTSPYVYDNFKTPCQLCKDRPELLALLNAPLERPVEQFALALERIEVARKGIASGVGWVELNLRNLGLTKLPPIPEGVYGLNLQDNQLTTINTLPDSLRDLNCSKNKLESLPSFPPNLYRFDCRQNRLSALPPLPASLVGFDCGANRLKSLPPMEHLINLVEFDCGGNLLTELPLMPTTKLQRIWCSTNRIERLPPLKHLTGLKQLRCGENRLTEIPELPDTIKLLNCGTNKLSVLPPLPKHMVELLTDGNLVYLGYINQD